jgi:hypothetical protein
MFLRNLFAPSGSDVPPFAEVALKQEEALKAVAEGRATSKPNPVAAEISSVVNDQIARGAPSPSPSASPTSAPAPTPTATPTPKPSGPPLSEEQKLAEALRQFQAEKAKTAATATPVDPHALTPWSQVWDGKRERPIRVIKDEKGQRSTHQAPETRSLTDVAMDPYRWDAQQAKKIALLMEHAGLDTKNADIKTMHAHWQGIVATAANFYQVGKQVSPMDVLKRISDGVQAAAPKTTTSTSTQYTVTNALTAEQLVHAALSQRLGRPASKEEIQEFKKALAAAEKKNPTTTTTTTTTDPEGGTSSSTSTTKQGINTSDFAVKWGEGHNKEEAKAYQTAGLIMPWFFEAIGESV